RGPPFGMTMNMKGSSGISGKRDREKKKVLQEFPGNMGVRCNEGYAPWIVRQGGRAECYAHEDADKAGYNGQSTEKRINALVLLVSCQLCPCCARVFMSVDASNSCCPMRTRAIPNKHSGGARRTTTRTP